MQDVPVAGLESVVRGAPAALAGGPAGEGVDADRDQVGEALREAQHLLGGIQRFHTELYQLAIGKAGSGNPVRISAAGIVSDDCAGDWFLFMNKLTSIKRG